MDLIYVDPAPLEAEAQALAEELGKLSDKARSLAVRVPAQSRDLLIGAANDLRDVRRYVMEARSRLRR